MPEPSGEDTNFKVVDRRAFTVEGARRENAELSEQAKEEARASKPQPAAPASPAGADRVDEGFAMLVELLANGALTHLGLLDNGAGDPLPVNLPGARAMIDLIGVLQDKTKGNLSPAEDNFLQNILFELHTRFVELQKKASSKRR